MLVNKLEINDDKKEVMVVVSRYYQPLVQCDYCILTVGDFLIQIKSKVNYLGVIFDAEASVVLFVNQTVRTCYYHLKSSNCIRSNDTQEACAAAAAAAARCTGMLSIIMPYVIFSFTVNIL